MIQSLSALVLAAGRSRRMNSPTSKVLHTLAGKPLILHVMSLLSSFSLDQVVVVVGENNGDSVKEVICSDVSFALQKEPKGTAHAVFCAYSFLEQLPEDSYILILCGDVPLLEENTVRSFIDAVGKKGGSGGVIVAPIPQGDQNYGRVFVSEDYIDDIVEYKELMDEQESVVGNTGVMLLRVSDLKHYLNNGIHQKKTFTRELVLTHIARFLKERGVPLLSFYVEGWDEFIGINSRSQLVEAEKFYQEREVARFLDKGVSFADPLSVYISSDVVIGQDTFIHPFVWIGRNVTIGKGCSILPFSKIPAGTVIEDYACFEGSHHG